MSVKAEEKLDAYQKWLEEQRQQELAQMAAGSVQQNPYTLQTPFSGQTSDASPSLLGDQKLQIASEYDPTPAANNFQLQEPALVQGMSGSTAAGVSDGTLAGAGIGAAGQAVGILAQIAGQQAAKQATLQQNQLNRDMSEKMARAALNQNQNQFNAASKMSAYQSLVAALNQAANQTAQQRQLKRGNEQSRAAGMTTAYLGA